MKEASYHWQVEEKKEIAPELKEALTTFGISENLFQYAAELGLKTQSDCRTFFQPDLSDLHDPYLLYDMEKSVERIRLAIEKGEKILIYGDYDADGITSTTVLKEAIEMVGGDVVYYLPNRFKDGYGPNVRVYDEFIKFGVGLIVTVDNGVSGNEAIAFAKAKGVDVVVTDHHELPEILPDAYSIVHPRHPKGNYPFGQLAGVGVAFKVACALLEEIPVELLELVAIGTIADLVPLVDENRALVQLGLQQFQYSDRLGLQALCKVAQINMATVNEETIGFQLAPRLNALGRLKDATEGVDLLSTFDQTEAEKLAKDIDAINEERKELVSTTMDAVLKQVNLAEPIIFAAHSGWHEGVLGIVAGKLMQDYHKPTFILTIDETTGLAKGSARSVTAFNVFEALQAQGKLFKAFGGHHMAAGFTLPVDNLEKLKAHLIARYEAVLAQGSVKDELSVPLTVPVSELDLTLVEQIKRFAPFGNAQKKPAVLVENAFVTNVRTLGVNGVHLKFQLRNSDQPVDAIAFNRGAESFEMVLNQPINFVVNLAVNEWNGIKKLQLQLIDYEVVTRELFDYRGQMNRLPELNEAQTIYFAFDEKNFKRLELSAKTQMTLETLEKISPMTNFIVVDCPADLATFKKVLEQTQAERIFLWCYTAEEAYLNGMPTHQKFGKLYKFILNNRDIDVRYKLSGLAKYFNIPQSTLIFMLNVFSELKFVTIDNGLLNANQDVATQDLASSHVYQNRLKQMKVEEFLLYAKVAELTAWLDSKEDNHES